MVDCDVVRDGIISTVDLPAYGTHVSGVRLLDVRLVPARAFLIRAGDDDISHVVERLLGFH